MARRGGRARGPRRARRGEIGAPQRRRRGPRPGRGESRSVMAVARLQRGEPRRLRRGIPRAGHSGAAAMRHESRRGRVHPVCGTPVALYRACARCGLHAAAARGPAGRSVSGTGAIAAENARSLDRACYDDRESWVRSATGAPAAPTRGDSSPDRESRCTIATLSQCRRDPRAAPATVNPGPVARRRAGRRSTRLANAEN